MTSPRRLQETATSTRVGAGFMESSRTAAIRSCERAPGRGSGGGGGTTPSRIGSSKRLLFNASSYVGGGGRRRISSRMRR